MTITYAIWQGSSLLAHSQTANSMKEIDTLIDLLNESKIGKKLSFSANVSRIEVK